MKELDEGANKKTGDKHITIKDEGKGKDDLVEILIGPDDAKEIYDKSKEGELVTLAIQLNETHHYHPDHSNQFPVQELKLLESIDPGLVVRAFKMLEKDQDAWIENDRSIRRLESHGLYGAIGLIILLSLCGIGSIYLGEPKVAYVIFSLTMVFLLTIMVLRKPWKSGNSKLPDFDDDS